MIDYVAEENVLRQRHEAALVRLFNYHTTGCPQPLLSAMTHSLFSGGKRIRPILLYQAASLFGNPGEEGDVLACALEMIHTASLIHDDMPAMDNDTIRRGKPTCHVVYGEGQALLAGDSLLNLAYELMLLHPIKESKKNAYYQACGILAKAAGSRGMCGGQCIDLSSEAEEAFALDRMNRMKTGALLRGAVEAGSVLCGASKSQRQALVRWADYFGLLFQLTDDILDITGNNSGKSIGKDVRDNKRTYVTLLGMKEAEALAEHLASKAIAALSDLYITSERSGYFYWITELTVHRTV